MELPNGSPPPTESETDTPRTDKVAQHWCPDTSFVKPQWVNVGFARALERENAALTRRVEELEKTNASLREDGDSLRMTLIDCREANGRANSAIGDIANECSGYVAQLAAALDEVAELKAKLTAADFFLAQSRTENTEHEQDYLAIWRLIKEPNETVVDAVKRLVAERDSAQSALQALTDPHKGITTVATVNHLTKLTNKYSDPCQRNP